MTSTVSFFTLTTPSGRAYPVEQWPHMGERVPGRPFLPGTRGSGCRAELDRHRSSTLAGGLVRLGQLLASEVAQLSHLRGDLGQRQLGLDDVEVESPDVLEHAAHPAGRVVPALA